MPLDPPGTPPILHPPKTRAPVAWQQLFWSMIRYNPPRLQRARNLSAATRRRRGK